MKILKIAVAFAMTALAVSTVKSGSDTDGYFNLAQEKIRKFKPVRTDFAIIVDYTKSLPQNRLYVLNMKTHEVVITSRVSHAFNSGVMYASDFSNKNGTNKSCDGTFVTAGSRQSRFGYSMTIVGLIRGVNDKAESRGIIFHSTSKMPTPWSNGCFATSEETNRRIIDLTKGGCIIHVIK